MTAEEKIRFTIAEYCHRTDSGDFEGWVKLFAEDGGFRMFGNEVLGHAALRAFIEQDQPPELRGLHLTTDSAITLQGDSAKVRSNFIFVAGGDEAGVVVAAGRAVTLGCSNCARPNSFCRSQHSDGVRSGPDAMSR
jgi:SnoaL-like domain